MKVARWAIIVDISIRIGGQRLLLALGVDLEKYNFDRPLSFGDVRVLSLGLRHERSWSAAAIVKHVEDQILPVYAIFGRLNFGGPPGL